MLSAILLPQPVSYMDYHYSLFHPRGLPPEDSTEYCFLHYQPISESTMCTTNVLNPQTYIYILMEIINDQKLVVI